MQRLLFVLAVVSGAAAVDFEKWKEQQSNRFVSTRQRTVYEGMQANADGCLGIAEDYPKPETYAVYFHTNLQMCQLFVRNDLGSYNEDTKVMTWTDGLTEVASGEHLMFVKQGDKKDEDSISDGGIVATIVLAIVFGLILVGCAIVCKEEESDIAGQLAALEKKEMEVEEAASEEWERRSEAEESKERAAAEKEQELEKAQ